MHDIETRERRESEYPNLRFEPGDHEPIDDPGPLWNREVVLRLAQYHPEFLSIDSLQAGVWLDYQMILSEALPGSPQQINPKADLLYIVRGDVWNFTQNNWPLDELIQVRLSDANRHVEEERSSIQREFAIAWFLSTVIVSASAIDFLRRPVRNRRDFLKRSLGLSAAALLTASRVGMLSAIVAPFTTSERDRDIFLRIASITRPILKDQHWWGDGRTALLIAKTQDAIDKLQKPRETRGAIIMGTVHAFRAESLLTNSRERSRALRDFCANTLEAADVVINELGLSPEIRLPTHEAILNQISLYDVIAVPTAPQSRDPYNLGFFKSPQVEAAIQEFR